MLISYHLPGKNSRYVLDRGSLEELGKFLRRAGTCTFSCLKLPEGSTDLEQNFHPLPHWKDSSPFPRPSVRNFSQRRRLTRVSE